MNRVEVKTQDLSGLALDWAVAKAAQIPMFSMGHHGNWPGNNAVTQATTSKPAVIVDLLGKLYFETGFQSVPWSPSTNWSQAGALIEQQRIGFGPVRRVGWVAHPHRPNAPTEWLEAEEPLVAICRAIVADKLGMVVSVPAELVP